ncbi:ubiquitin carboxyl-terminal hydrolase 35 [Drosophila mauritiana]|uniref:Ubiquitin carboxyl-terminal hydrolase 35 n=1 Tax=Drosophila mauritiana TaxID=7226 RepID=A0A6P8JK42_DROMA|nr:ubiquitin carboxyl-terminal hydrolase 35 [Drosophila mauritiana]
MAVKQNNSEAGDASDNAGGAGNGIPPNAKPMSANGLANAEENVVPKGMDTGSPAGESLNSNRSGKRDIKALLAYLQSIDMPEQGHNVMAICERVIVDLARLQIPRGASCPRLKEDVCQVGAFLATRNEKFHQMFYLRVVYELITKSPFEPPPSCAVAIVFQLFDSTQILEAVHSLLEQNVQDSSIKKTVNLLCDWITYCTFCSTLNLWVLALLKGLRDQGKMALLDEIAMDNIEKLFHVMIFPALRQKAAPVVFHMLSTINQTPEVFHKILPRIPRVLQYVKNQSATMDEIGLETKKCLQQLVDLTSALMLRFYDQDELYVATKKALQTYEPSPNCVALAQAMHENAQPWGRRNARVGLVNLGNTCYMNSVLQALAMTSDFSRQILLIEGNSVLLMKVQQQIALMHHSLRYELTPSKVLNATRPPSFTPGLQQDSSEFLGHLLDLLHEHEIGNSLVTGHSVGPSKTGKEMDDVPALLSEDILSSGVIPYNSKDHELSSGSNSDNCNHKPTPTLPATPTKATNGLQQQDQQVDQARPPSTIDKTFAGKLSTTYRCLSCGWESRNEDSFRELQLSFPDDQEDCGATNYSVQDLIEYYCSPEKLDGENQYFCPQCKRLCDAERHIGVTQAPKNLILTLKQFKYDQKYHFRTKLMHKVFHDESVTVKMSAKDSLQEISTVHYDLYAGVVHAGYSMDSGHYFTFAADQAKNWYKFNDNVVTHSKPEEMHNLTSPNTPYILFYKMCGHSNESNSATASCSSSMVSRSNDQVVSVPLAPPLKLEELPRRLRDYVRKDNHVYNEELKMQRFKRGNSGHGNAFVSRHNFDGDGDEDDKGPPPPGGCGSNGLGMNINRFVF